MRMVINWIRSHLPIVICGTVTLLAIVMLVLGVLKTDTGKAMASDESLVRNIRSLPQVNERVLRELQAERQRLETQVEATMAKLEQFGDHQVINPDVFPVLNPENQSAIFKFKVDYIDALEAMLVTLRANDRPTSEEVEEERKFMAAQKARQEGLQELGRVREERTSPFGTPRGSRPRRGLGEPVQGEERSPEELAREDPAVRIAIRRARNTYCYANLNSFNPRGTITGVDRPELDEMWYAQMAVWIQQDMVRALAGLNNRIAQSVEARGDSPWVGNLPVKHLISVDVDEYMPQVGGAGGGRARGRRSARRGGSDSSAVSGFTGRTGTPELDVLHLSMHLIVEARLLPSVIDEISKAGLYTVLDLDYVAVPPNRDLRGYIYGWSPSIEVLMKIEGCFLRSEYEEIMPEEVKEAIASGHAGGSKSGRGGGSMQFGADRSGPGGSQTGGF